MTINSMLEWIESTHLSIAIREGGLPYPIIGGIHLLAIAWFGGMVLASDLRLLGWLMPARRFSDMWYQFRPWKRLGFVVVVTTGFLLAWAEPMRLWGSPAFWVKMSLFALVGVHALVFREKVYGHPEKQDACISSQAKLAAVLSLILWAGMVMSGRLIAYDESFEPRPLGKYRPTSHAVGTRVGTRLPHRDSSQANGRLYRWVQPRGDFLGEQTNPYLSSFFGSAADFSWARAPLSMPSME